VNNIIPVPAIILDVNYLCVALIFSGNLMLYCMEK